MQFEWTDNLSEEQIISLKQFYLSLPLVHVEQYPCWNDVDKTEAKVNYCIATYENVLKGYVAVYEYRKIEARIVFGPLSHSLDVSLQIILDVIQYYKRKGFFSLQVLLGMSVGTDATYLQYSLFKRYPFKFYLNENNKGTLLLELRNKTEDQLLKHFSNGHRYDIKKAYKNNLVCKLLQSSDEIVEFSNGYSEMYRQRGIHYPVDKSSNNFLSIHNWIETNKSGFFLGVFENRVMIGGALILFRNDRAQYYRGFSLPGNKKQPISHIALFESMKRVMLIGIPYFDFGGYNILVSEKDQVYQINKFKKGFHGEYFFYPPTMYFDLKPMGTALSHFLKRIKRMIV